MLAQRRSTTLLQEAAPVMSGWELQQASCQVCYYSCDWTCHPRPAWQHCRSCCPCCGNMMLCWDGLPMGLQL